MAEQRNGETQMAFDEGLAKRLLHELRDLDAVTEKRSFGAYGVMLHGNRGFGVIGEELVVRVGSDAYEDALALPHARPFDFTGRPMKGWVYVSTEGFQDDEDFKAWVARGVEFVLTLPEK